MSQMMFTSGHRPTHTNTCVWHAMAHLLLGKSHYIPEGVAQLICVLQCGHKAPDAQTQNPGRDKSSNQVCTQAPPLAPARRGNTDRSRRALSSMKVPGPKIDMQPIPVRGANFVGAALAALPRSL